MLKLRFISALTASLCFLLTAPVWAHPGHGFVKQGEFRYDQADRRVKGTMLKNDLWYEADILAAKDGGLWLTWLEYTPGEGDQVWIGRRENQKWVRKRQVTRQAGRYATPTLTRDASGTVWLSYEDYDRKDKQWDIKLRRIIDQQRIAQPLRISPGAGNDINHAIAAGPSGGLWVVWQGDRNGQFQVMARHVNAQGEMGDVHVLSNSPWGDWQPAVAVGPQGRVTVVWDSYDGDSYNILARRHSPQGQWSPIIAVATGPAHQAHADVAIDSTGRTWVLWEEGGRNWGEPYLGSEHIIDANGPLHLFRMLHVAVLKDNGAVAPLADPLPMPALYAARHRSSAHQGAHLTGTYYEGGKLAVDEQDRVWVVYRHFYMPQIGATCQVDAHNHGPGGHEELKHHIEEGWRLYARRLQGGGWSDLIALTPHQRDGMQRLSITTTDEGLALAWTTGRTDRRPNDSPRGVALATIQLPDAPAPRPRLAGAYKPVAPEVQPIPAPPEPVTVGGKTYRLFFGDLHRHTDLSLCFPFLDGSLGAAYRYAIDAAHLDFLGITDHTRDIARGDALSQLWWRSTKQVTRHRLRDTFFPYFAYERSGGPADHNVISLRDDMLRSYKPPLTDFWAQIDHGDTFTIPHNPMRNKHIWEHHDPRKRPLIEVYQGYRDEVMINVPYGADYALSKGIHIGFIASSDHQSTNAGFAAVWAPEADREKIFRSMQARRTYAATDQIRLIFRSGSHWMGERFTANSRSGPPFQIDIEATAPIQSIEIFRDGKRVARLQQAKGQTSFHATWRPKKPLRGEQEHYFYIHVLQQDGNQAWSSPIWVKAQGNP